MQTTEQTRPQQVLEEIRKTHDTTALSEGEFSEVCRAILFYAKGAWSVEQIARLVIEEITWPNQ